MLFPLFIKAPHFEKVLLIKLSLFFLSFQKETSSLPFLCSSIHVFVIPVIKLNFLEVSERHTHLLCNFSLCCRALPVADRLVIIISRWLLIFDYGCIGCCRCGEVSVAYNLMWGQKPGPHVDERHSDSLCHSLYLLIAGGRRPVNAKKGTKK